MNLLFFFIVGEANIKLCCFEDWAFHFDALYINCIALCVSGLLCLCQMQKFQPLGILVGTLWSDMQCCLVYMENVSIWCASNQCFEWSVDAKYALESQSTQHGQKIQNLRAMLMSLSWKFMAILQSAKEMPNMVPTNEDKLTFILCGPLHAQCYGLINFHLASW